MRFILLMASLVIVSLLVFKGYPGIGGGKNAAPVVNQQPDLIEKANRASQLVEDTVNKQKQALENQLQ